MGQRKNSRTYEDTMWAGKIKTSVDALDMIRTRERVFLVLFIIYALFRLLIELGKRGHQRPSQ